MPELPEVQTTVNGLRKYVVGHTIKDAWSDYNSAYFKGSQTIKDPVYFEQFRRAVIGKKIIGANRRAKNILIELEEGKDGTKGSTILVHMKMTGHLLYGRYEAVLDHEKAAHKKWRPIEPEGLKDPYNRHIRFILTLDNDRHLALCDTRRFAKVALIETESLHSPEHLKGIGPEPLDESFTYEKFIEQIALRPSAPIKLVLMDQTIIAGIGNIYADESLWRAGINPLQKPSKLKSTETHSLFHAIKDTLSKGIDLGGDSMSDYRNIHGEKGGFQETHRAYRKTGEKCSKKGCKGMIVRIVVGGRSTHYCNEHQALKTK